MGMYNLLFTQNVFAHKVLTNNRLEEIAISYNGGKDCLVMLILLLASVHIKFVGTELPPNYKLDSIYINSEIQFPALTDFIEELTSEYHLNPIHIKLNLKDGFEAYLNNINPKIKAIVVGVRSSDPYSSKLQFEQFTDHNWPRFLRIHPMLDWNYTDVWDFLIGTNLEYCELYDGGFTSLGGVHNTIPNPHLMVEVGEYLPAYRMREHADERERLGRLPKH